MTQRFIYFSVTDYEMALQTLYLKDFRLFNQKKIDLSGNNTIIVGDNGSGKTSVLEAINILLEGTSHRTKEIKECVREGGGEFQIALNGRFNQELISSKAVKALDKRISFIKKKGLLPGKAKDFPIPSLILASHLRMIEGEPELRRAFFNKTMFHVEQSSKESYLKYQRALIQRNKALKGRLPEKELIIWTNNLRDAGLELNKKNLLYFVRLEETIQASLKETKNRENLTFLEGLELQFNQGWSRELEFGAFLNETFDKDKALGFTGGGPHRLDLIISIGKKRAKSLLSRGQQKLLILLLFINIYSLINQYHLAGLVFLIDDITSEMDEENLSVILKELKSLKSQIILTALDGKIANKTSNLLDEFTHINLSNKLK